MSINSILKRVLVFLYNYNKTRIYRNKIKKIFTYLKINQRETDKNILKKHKAKWKPLKKTTKLHWYLVFSKISGKNTVDFIPEDLYYTVVEPAMNNKQMSKAFADKNFYQQYISKKLLPEVIFHNVDGVFYDTNFNLVNIDKNIASLLKNENEVIIKPAIDTGGGKAVDLFKMNEHGKYLNNKGAELTIDYINKFYKSNYLIQKKLIQHPYFAQFNPSSVNTVRIFTYRSVKDEKVHVLQSLLRIGKPNSVTDNQASGGVSVHIKKDGKLNDFAVNKMGDVFTEYGGIRLANVDPVPNYKELKELAIEIGHKEPYSRLLGFDFIVDSNGNNKIIEVNNLNNEINFYQMNNGPLFGSFTDEVINYCKKAKKTFLIDFQYE